MPFKKYWITSAHRGFTGDSGVRENTMEAYRMAVRKHPDMMEIDARMAKDGVLMCNHDAELTVNGKTYSIAEESSEVLRSEAEVPTVEETLDLCYHTGTEVNIDMKDNGTYTEELCRLVLRTGMRGHVIYALNLADVSSVKRILDLDSDARFMNRIERYTDEMYAAVPDYRKRFFAYTSDFSPASVEKIREKGVNLACISLRGDNFEEALKWHPEMCEFPHTSDFEKIEEAYFQKYFA